MTTPLSFPHNGDMKAKPDKRYAKGTEWFTFAHLGDYRVQVSIDTGDTRLLYRGDIVEGTPKFRSSAHAAEWIHLHMH